jgi:SAM-dependent methyltransferase
VDIGIAPAGGEAAGVVAFRCNVCGAGNELPVGQVHREMLCCAGCRANARFRGIVRAVQEVLLEDTETALRAARPRREVRGVGMSDSGIYAGELARLFDYRNTFYHMAPLLDVTDAASTRQYRELDFVVSSDVLEHVRAPVSEALENIRGMLKPGGVLILSVPYLRGYMTIEHYPHLMEYEIVAVGGKYAVVNVRADGLVEQFPAPVFHGGPGSVLEMRVFGEGDLMATLAYAGFEVRVLEASLPEIGYVWRLQAESALWRGRESKSFVMVCRNRRA